MLEKWKQSLQVYFDRRMLTMILLGFSSGFPFLLVFGTFNLRLKDAGVSLAAIGLFSLVKTPYSFKWLWSPLVDRIRLPLFCKLGRRRGWALFSQLLLIIAIWAMALVDPATSPLSIAIFAFLMTIASATQDIVLDAYRIESFSTREQGAGVAVFVLGYRLGSIFSGAGALFLAAVMDWENVYKIMSLGALAGILAILFSKEPREMPGMIAVYVTVASIICKLLLSLYQTAVGKKTGSSMLIANGINMRNDVIISLSVLVGLFFSFILEMPVFDSITALLVSIFIIRSAIMIFMDSNVELMDGVKDTWIRTWSSWTESRIHRCIRRYSTQ